MRRNGPTDETGARLRRPMPGGGSALFGNTSLPSGAFEQVPVLFPYWDDLDLSTTGGGIYTNLVGVAPTRQFVVEWRGKRFDDPGVTQTLNFGVVFNENSSVIEFRYPQTGSSPTAPNGSDATVGAQNGATLGQYTQYAFNQGIITNGTVLRGTLSGGCVAASTGQCSTPLFADVPSGSVGAREINSVYNHIPRITNGCSAGPLSFCPTTPVTREQMAAFIIRGKEGEPDPNLCAGGSPFGDVPQNSPFCPHIKRLLQLGVTVGCSTGVFCPTGFVTRESMAVFLVRAVDGVDPPANLCAGGSPFTDVAQNSPFCPHIKRVQQLGITNGCGATTYCPSDFVNRAQMAIFLVRAFAL